MTLLPVDELLAELERRRRPRQTPELDAMMAGLHPKQLAFVNDKSRRKTALCSRRAGKSWGIAADLLTGGFSDPGGLSVYIAKSKGDARMILWPDVLEKMDQEFKLGLKLREIDNQLMVELPNRHRLWLAGCKDVTEIEKFRGKKYRKAVVDEAQRIAFLSELISAVLQPALIDKRGELILAGTPSPIPAGMFYEKTTGDGSPRWPTYEWTILDNPHIPHAAEELRLMREEYGWDEEHPTYQREWRGLWVRDEGSLIYPFQGDKNTFDARPDEGQWQFAIGVDLGYTSSTAWVVACCRRGHPEVYILEVEKREGLIPSAVAAHCDRFLKKYPGAQLVVDAGGLGKGYVEEMRQSYGVPAQPAVKGNKRAFQELVAGDMRSGVIRLDPWKCRALIDEIQILQWTPDKSEEDDRFENHAADAFLYAVRALRPHYRPEENEPKEGSPEWQKREFAKERRQAQEAAKKRSKRNWRAELVWLPESMPLAA